MGGKGRQLGNVCLTSNLKCLFCVVLLAFCSSVAKDLQAGRVFLPVHREGTPPGGGLLGAWPRSKGTPYPPTIKIHSLNMDITQIIFVSFVSSFFCLVVFVLFVRQILCICSVPFQGGTSGTGGTDSLGHVLVQGGGGVC